MRMRLPTGLWLAALLLSGGAQTNLPRIWLAGGSVDYITQIALTPDGRYLVSSDHSGFVRLWRVEDRQLIWTRHFTGGIDRSILHADAVRVSPDGQWITCTLTNRSYTIFQASGFVLRLTDGAITPVNLGGAIRFDFHPEGQLLAYSDRVRLRIIRLSDGAPLFEASHPFGLGQGDLVFVPQTDFVCLLGWSEVQRATLLRVWNWRTGAVVHESSFPRVTPGRLAVTADGRYLATSLSDDLGGCYLAVEAVVFEPRNQWRVTAHLSYDRTHTRLFMGCLPEYPAFPPVAFSPDGSLLAVGGAAISLWDTRTWTNRRSIVSPDGYALSLCFRDTATLFAGYANGRLLLWRLERDPLPVLRKRLGNLVFSAAVSADGQIGVLCDLDGSLEVWHLMQGRRLWIHWVPQNLPRTVTITRQGDRVAHAVADGIVIRDALTGEARQVIPIDGAPLSFNAEGDYLLIAQSEGFGSRILAWNLLQNRLERTIPHGSWPLNVRLSADGQYLMLQDNITVTLLNWRTGEMQQQDAGIARGGFELTPDHNYLVQGGLTFASLRDDRFWRIGRAPLGAGAALSEQQWAVFNYHPRALGEAVGACDLNDLRLRWWERVPKNSYIVFTPDGRRAFIASWNAVGYVDLTAQHFPEPISALTIPVKQVETLPNEELCLASASNSYGTDLATINLRTGQVLQFREHEQILAIITTGTTTNRFGFVAHGESVQVWPLFCLFPEYTYYATSRSLPRRAWFTAHDRYLLVESEGILEVWDTQLQVRTQSRSSRASFTPRSGEWLITTASAIALRRMPRGELIRYLYPTMGYSLALAPSGRFLIVLDSPDLSVIRLDLFPERVAWRWTNPVLYLCQIEPQERYFIGISRFQPMEAALYRTSDGARLFTFPYTERRFPVELAISPDGDLVAALYSDGVIEFYDPFTFQRVADYRDEVGTPLSSALQFTRDGRHLLFGRHDGSVLLIPNPRFYLPGDVDGDGCIGDTDLLRVLLRFGDAFIHLPEDITQDGQVDDADLIAVLLRFGQGCAQ